MWLWLRKIFIYLLLLVYRHKWHNDFVREVTKHCRKRRHRKHVPGITEELDEDLHLPDDCTDDVYFAGFTEDGHVASFRINRNHTNHEIAQVGLEIPGVGRFVFSDTRTTVFGVGKLSLTMLEPMSRWKINFHAPMELLESQVAENNQLRHVSVSLYWQCLEDPFDHWTSPSTWQLACNLAQQSFNSNFWDQIRCQNLICYEQWGELWGRIDVAGHESQFLRMKSFRRRQIGRGKSKQDEKLVLHRIVVDGGALYLTNGCVVEGIRTGQRFGYLTYPAGEEIATDQSSLSIENSTMSYPFSTLASGIVYYIEEGGARKPGLTVETDSLETTLNFSLFQVNGKRAYGIQLEEVNTSLSLEVICREARPIFIPQSNNSKFTVDLKSDDCRDISLVGGKGSRLSVLLCLGHTVPSGFCITVNMLNAHIESNVNLKQAKYHITEALKRDDINLSDVCTETVQLFTDTDLSLSLKTCIEQSLKDTFGEDFKEKPFAVRSSGVSEDGGEASSAGQMETFLGIKGLNNITQCVLKCWASSFAYRVVEYRRQNGQPLVEPMGVVVQEMVDADVAGVLFTNDPVTGDTTKMLVNASFGLGEMVVSGQTTPDTIRVKRGRKGDPCEILEKTAGDKVLKMVLSTTGVCEIENDGDYAETLSLTDEQILRLCDTGLKIENSFGCPQDIEWAIADGEMHILQTRPITTLLEETDEELIHEFDTPVAFNRECLTTYNISEMFPGTGTPLTQCLFVKACSDGLRTSVGRSSGTKFPAYAYRCAGICTNKPYLSMTGVSVGCVNGVAGNKNDIEVYVTGHSIDAHTIDDIVTYKGKLGSKIVAFKNFIETTFFFSGKQTKAFGKWAEDEMEWFSIGDLAPSAPELYGSIDARMDVFFRIWGQNLFKSSESSFPFAVIMGILRGKSTSMTTECQADLALLLSSCKNVYSADVPTAISSIAKAIMDSDIKDQFMKSPDEKGHVLLMDAEDSIRTKYQDFLKKQGHRCVKEAEFMIKSWAEEPSKLVRAIKQIIRSPSMSSSEPVKVELANRPLVESLKTPLSWFQKYLIANVFLDKARYGVAAREWGKSVTIKMSDAFKKAYWRLADLMVRECYLPEKELMFFLTHPEIGLLLESRSASLVRKARRRMRVLSLQEEINYPPIMFGRPVPLPDIPEPESDASCMLKGMPVGKGISTGRACVVTCLAEADKIQKGDILVCPFTDVGWSPYFPLISGLVTEKGGLISHGAVVAREVGIPCIVSVPNATRVFKTGDRVKIHGLEGVIQKVTEY